MAASTYDVVTVGGGLAGAGFARVMAVAGARVLVLERSATFRDRVRGEVLMPWGVVEAERLGLGELLQPIANELRTWVTAVAGTTILERDVVPLGRAGRPVLTYYHPAMQDLLLDAAAAAGAEIRRDARVTGVAPGAPATVTFRHGNGTHEARARLVVGADGRGSAVRSWAGFGMQRDPERRLFAGVLFDEHRAPADVLYSGFLPGTGLMTYVFPQGEGRARCYVGYQHGTDVARFQGGSDVPRFVETALRVGAPAEWYTTARPAGPLATFDATDEWVSRPYRDGVALVGDAAATSDPTWGQGMSVTLRDLRLLRDALAAGDDWDAAGHRYAEAHDAFHRHVHDCDGWFTDIFCDVGPAADARRQRALPHLLADPTRIPDTPFAGPEVVADEHARRRFFGEDV